MGAGGAVDSDEPIRRRRKITTEDVSAAEVVVDDDTSLMKRCASRNPFAPVLERRWPDAFT